MNVTETCYGCLKGLVEKTVALSGGDGVVCSSLIDLLDELWEEGGTPPHMANTLLRRIKEVTGVHDPFEPIKKQELQRAVEAAKRLDNLFPPTLEGALKFSAFGNSTDFFVQEGFSAEGFRFVASMDKIEEEIYIRGKEVLLLGDNIGDFFFDMKLLQCLAGIGKRVYYAVREHPVQNDLSMKDVSAFGLTGLFEGIISTGTDEVGIQRSHFEGVMKDLWEGDGLVIAKGMGNYETISSFHDERPVMHVMKIKCAPVGNTLNQSMGTYIAILGGDHDGREKRLL
jgi:uncharacterized protein with ATP-grasp and redox domains